MLGPRTTLATLRSSVYFRCWLFVPWPRRWTPSPPRPTVPCCIPTKAPVWCPRRTRPSSDAAPLPRKTGSTKDGRCGIYEGLQRSVMARALQACKHARVPLSRQSRATCVHIAVTRKAVAQLTVPHARVQRVALYVWAPSAMCSVPIRWGHIS